MLYDGMTKASNFCDLRDKSQNHLYMITEQPNQIKKKKDHSKWIFQIKQANLINKEGEI